MQKIKLFINKFIENPIWLFALLIVINYIPTIGLLVTEPLNLFGKIVLAFFPLGLYLILYSLSKKVGLVGLLLFPLLFFHAFQIVVFSLFGEDVIAADMFLNVVTTSVSEAGEVLNSLVPAVLFVVIIYLPATIFSYKAMKGKVYLDKQFQYKTFMTGVILVVSSYVVSFFAVDYNTKRFTYYEDVYPINLFYNLDFAVDRWRMSEDYHKTCANFDFEAKRDTTANQREIYVLVVGETGRAGNWSLYGYDRKTTPHLDADTNLVFYKDAITQTNTTHKSVPIILSAASAEEYDRLYHQKSILTAFKEVGFKTIFLSNQAANRTFTDFFANEADIHEYYRFFGNPVNEYDEILVDKMKHYIDAIDGNLFIVLHTYGSHFNYTERYPEQFSQFKPDIIPAINKKYIKEMVNAYDNTILYTDYVLKQVIETLAQTDACTAMFYCTDHGEDILDDNRERFLHASPKPTFYQLRIPFLFWFSPTYQEAFPEKVYNTVLHKDCPVATNIVFHSVLDMASIETNNSYSYLSVMSDEFKTLERMYLDDHYQPIPYVNAGLKKQDVEMLDKVGMVY